jgi:branched-chain amino acid transport system ATP-binding protein
MALLEVRNLTKYFGGLAAVNNLNFEVNEREILGLIGPNGAGKSTVFNLITSYYKPSKGIIIFNGKNITNLKTHQIAQLGIVRTFQKTNVFMDMSVSKNINIAHHLKCKTSDWGKFIFNSKARKEEQEIIKNTDEIMESIGLLPYKSEQAKNLPHGLLRLLEIGIALAVEPKLILLDEPFTGMNPNETNKLIETVKSIQQKKGYTIILVEHNMPVVMEISDRIIVMNFGNKIAEERPIEILKNQKVIEAYIGKDTE